MEKSKRLFKIYCIGLLGLIIVACQKEDTKMIFEADSITELNSMPLDLINEYNDLLNLISTIETMAIDGLLSKGEANSLIVKVNNAIKSLEKSNINAFSGLINAFIIETGDYIDNGILTIEQGHALTNVAEYIVNSFTGTPVITDGLIAFYPFNGSVNDGSSNDRDGIASNITYSADRNEDLNSAVTFSGDGFVRIPGIGQTNSSFSLAFWYKTAQDGSLLATDNIFMGADDEWNQFITSWNISIGTYAAAGNPVYFNNTWHHVVITHDSDAGVIITYFDGVLRHNRPESGYFLGNNEDIYIGAVVKEYMVSYPYISPYFVGSVDDIYFFNRAISSNEVEQLFYYPHETEVNEIVYSNLNPDGTLGENGWSINDNASHAFSFMPINNFMLTSVDLAISDISEGYPFPTWHEFDVAIYSDNNGSPGDILISERETAPFFPYYEKPAFLTKVLFTSEVIVEAGKKYWIAIHPAGIPADFAWWWNAYDLKSEDYGSTPPTLGGEWQLSGIFNESAFQINGTPANN